MNGRIKGLIMLTAMFKENNRIQLLSGIICTLLLGLILSSTGYSAVVKMSSSHICHPEYSPYYSRIKNFTSYNTLQACLDAGGHLPKGLSRAGSTSSSITVQRHNPNKAITSKNGTSYKRSYFGHGWADIDHDCQNSRMEALVAQSTAPVKFKTDRECQVIAGRWISPFTNAVIHNASSIDIDHMVPLKWAWIHGAESWTQDKREQFANDPANLLSVESSLNREKGAKGPSEWLPPKNQCQYVLRFERVVKKYKLQESDKLYRVRQRVCN